MMLMMLLMLLMVVVVVVVVVVVRCCTRPAAVSGETSTQLGSLCLSNRHLVGSLKLPSSLMAVGIVVGGGWQLITTNFCYRL